MDKGVKSLILLTFSSIPVKLLSNEIALALLKYSIPSIFLIPLNVPSISPS